MIGRLLVAPVTGTVKLVKIVGVGRAALLGVGAAAGALLTPVTGTELRRALAAEFAKRRSGSEETVEVRVRRRLEGAPRTWHLDQPEVVAVPADNGAGWRIVLAGTAPDEASAKDLGDTAQGVTGVVDVDNRVRVDTPDEVH